MKHKKILAKHAVYKDHVYLFGGNKGRTCEKAKIGEWKWKQFQSYSPLWNNNLSKCAFA